MTDFRQAVKTMVMAAAPVMYKNCMYQKCRSLAYLDMTGFDTASAIDMYRLCGHGYV